MLGSPKTCTQRSLEEIPRLECHLLGRLYQRYSHARTDTALTVTAVPPVLNRWLPISAPFITGLGPNREKKLSMGWGNMQEVLLKEFLPLSTGNRSIFHQVITSPSQTGTIRNSFSGEINIILS